MRSSEQILHSVQFQQFKKSFLQIRGLPFSEILSPKTLTQFIERCMVKRERIFTPLVILKAFLMQVLSEDGSCKHAVVRVLVERLHVGTTPNTINTGPYCKARLRLPLSPLKELATEIGQELHELIPSQWNWKGHRIIIVDGTTVLMPDTQVNQECFPQQNNQKPGLGFPIARIVVLTSLGAGTIIDYVVGPYQGKGTGETSLFSKMFDSLNPGDLINGRSLLLYICHHYNA